MSEELQQIYITALAKKHKKLLKKYPLADESYAERIERSNKFIEKIKQEIINKMGSKKKSMRIARKLSKQCKNSFVVCQRSTHYIRNSSKLMIQEKKDCLIKLLRTFDQYNGLRLEYYEYDKHNNNAFWTGEYVHYFGILAKW